MARYRMREHTAAFARAIAYGRRAEMIVHEIDGSVVRRARSTLTYPTLLS